MITDPKIAGTMILSFKTSDAGGNSWEYLDNKDYLRFVTYPTSKNTPPQVRISIQSGDRGFRHLVTFHFKSEGDIMRAADIFFDDSQKYPLNGGDSFTVGKTCFSKEWKDHGSSLIESFSMTWNNERPFKERVTYSAKEATVNCIRIIEEYNNKIYKLD